MKVSYRRRARDRRDQRGAWSEKRGFEGLGRLRCLGPCSLLPRSRRLAVSGNATLASSGQKKTHPQASWSRLYREAQALTCVYPPFLSTCIVCCVHALQELRKHESSHLPRPLGSCSPLGCCPQQALAAPSDSRHCRPLRMLTELVAISTGRWTGTRLTRPGCRLNLRTLAAPVPCIEMLFSKQCTRKVCAHPYSTLLQNRLGPLKAASGTPSRPLFMGDTTATQ